MIARGGERRKVLRWGVFVIGDAKLRCEPDTPRMTTASFRVEGGGMSLAVARFELNFGQESRIFIEFPVVNLHGKMLPVADGRTCMARVRGEFLQFSVGDCA